MKGNTQNEESNQKNHIASFLSFLSPRPNTPAKATAVLPHLFLAPPPTQTPITSKPRIPLAALRAPFLTSDLTKLNRPHTLPLQPGRNFFPRLRVGLRGGRGEQRERRRRATFSCQHPHQDAPRRAICWQQGAAGCCW